MSKFNPGRPRVIFPGLKSSKPQYVLITRNGTERTSNVTEEKIYDAIYDIEDNGSVCLEKCVPVVIIRYAKAFSIDYFKDCSLAICFMVKGCMLRMWRSGVDCDLALDIMCDFFRTAALPDMTGWKCQRFYPEEEKTEEKLCVDGEDFRFFGCADIIGALENIIEGKSLWMIYDFNDEYGGYINIHRCGGGADVTEKYKVEYVRWTKPTPTGYRGIISDANSLRSWLWELIDGDKRPGPMSEWEQFDVNDYFDKMVFRFTEETKEDER